MLSLADSSSLSPNGQFSWAPDIHVEGLYGHPFMSFHIWISESEFSTLRVFKLLLFTKFYQKIPPVPQTGKLYNYPISFFPFIPIIFKESLCPIISILNITPHCSLLLTLLPLVSFSPLYSLPSALGLFFRNLKLFVVGQYLVFSHNSGCLHMVSLTLGMASKWFTHMVNDILLHKSQLRFSPWRPLSFPRQLECSIKYISPIQYRSPLEVFFFVW